MYTTAHASVITVETAATSDAELSGAPTAALAWLMRDVTHVPGVLTLNGGRLRFVSSRRVIFDRTPDELDLDGTRARRGMFRLTVDGERLRLTVVRPSGGTAVPADLVAREAGDAPTRGDQAAVAVWAGLLAPAARTVETADGRRPLRRAVAACLGRTTSARRGRAIDSARPA